MNFSICIILGNFAVLMGEVGTVQSSRHACTIVGCLIQFFYVAAAFIMAGEGHATFKAITSGVIGGRTLVYLPFAYGIALISLGSSIYMDLETMGTDPRCWVAWDNLPKWLFFGTVLGGAAISIILASIILCNLARPAIRK